MKNSRHLVQAVLMCGFVTFSMVVVAQQSTALWEDASAISDEFAHLLPDTVSYQRAVTIGQAQLQQLQIGDMLRLELLPEEIITVRLLSSRQYLNGDLGWSGTTTIAGRLATLSLVLGTNTVLASINTGETRYTVSARQDDSSAYFGYLYTQGENLPRIPIDLGGVQPVNPPTQSEFQSEFALSGNDVTISQSASADVAVIGEQVDFTIVITNNTNATITNEELNILFVLEDALLVSSSGNCTTANVGSQFSLQCALPDIAPSANTSIDYSVQLTDDSYPFIDSAAFVGDVFSNENVRNDTFVFVAMDTLQDSDNDGQSDFNESLTGTDPDSAFSVIDQNAVVETDLMFLYTQKFVDDIGGLTPETKINQLVEITNGYYANSRANISFRPVLYRLVDYQVNDSLNTTFDQLQNSLGVFSFVPETRDKVGADIVVLMDGVFENDGICGLGTTPGVGYSGELFHQSISIPDLYVTQYSDGFGQGGGSGCDDLTLAHELGHNHGLDHSHRELGARGTFPWALGHGVDGSFATIMASPSDFPGSSEIPLFSNPESTDCNGLPCGVSRADLEQGADAVHTLNHSRFQVSNRRSSRILPITGLAGSSNLIAYGGASRSSDLTTPVNSFAASDAIDVRATLEIPSEHQGSVGETYVVISVAGLELFYRDAGGNYHGWDGDLNSLQPNITPRELNATEELIAFENFVPVSVGVDEASLTVYFAYAIPGTDVFSFTSNGVPLTIQP